VADRAFSRIAASVILKTSASLVGEVGRHALDRSLAQAQAGTIPSFI
jgi:hypothetical protein